MEAHEKSFTFMNGPIRIEIPFFQRGYVWNQDNWRALIEDLLDKKSSHFLGSIILKAIKTESGEIPRWSLIDGQQRLTTLSVLLRACYDKLPLSTYDDEIQGDLKRQMQDMLFYKEKSISATRKAKIQHSLVDSAAFCKVINGELIDKLDDIILLEEATKEKKASDGILQCYKFFCTYLNNDKDKTEKLWELLQDQNTKILVKIDLDADENEQAIFDTVNSAGVRLTCADTIKNSIFQYAIDKVEEIKRTHEVLNVKLGDQTVCIESKETVIAFYKKTWENTFGCDGDTIGYWGTLRPLGRIARDNLEILLHSIALIKGIYNPEEHKMLDLPDVYKEYTKNLSAMDLMEFIIETCSYGEIYRKWFCTFDATTLYSYKKPIQRLFHILNVCDISTFHAYILKLLSKYDDLDEDNLPTDIAVELHNLEIIAIRHVVCGSSTKNFNKNCADLLADKTTTADLIKDRQDEIGDNILIQKVKSISNKHATLLLFWLELKRRSIDSKCAEKELKYCYTLEHIMPQKWQEFWPVNCPVVKDINGQDITDIEMAEEVRSAAIYEIGNMVLLVSNLNTSIRNYEFKRKMEGEGRKTGVKKYDYLLYTKDVTELYDKGDIWDEIKIHARTNELTDEILKMW
ncbi:MAG: DUF262 domain-containing protein [Lachnospiraceae bacterium]|nr:DUF262 domain-containing protein [Lachnospiraceae bacterium]